MKLSNSNKLYADRSQSKDTFIGKVFIVTGLQNFKSKFLNNSEVKVLNFCQSKQRYLVQNISDRANKQYYIKKENLCDPKTFKLSGVQWLDRNQADRPEFKDKALTLEEINHLIKITHNLENKLKLVPNEMLDKINIFQKISNIKLWEDILLKWPFPQKPKVSFIDGSYGVIFLKQDYDNLKNITHKTKSSFNKEHGIYTRQIVPSSSKMKSYNIVNLSEEKKQQLHTLNLDCLNKFSEYKIKVFQVEQNPDQLIFYIRQDLVDYAELLKTVFINCGTNCGFMSDFKKALNKPFFYVRLACFLNLESSEDLKSFKTECRECLNCFEEIKKTVYFLN